MARVFDGTSQYLERTSAVISSGAASFVGWIYLEASTDLAYGPGIYSSTTNNFWHIRHVNGQGWGAFWYAGALSSHRYVGSNSSTGWHHVVGTWTSTNTNAPSLYVDGAAITGTSQNGSLTLNVDRTGIQTNNSGSRAYGKGRNAEHAIYAATLDASEVKAIYDGCALPEIRPASLVAYWPLGGHYGKFDLDRWKNRYDLTPSGSPTWTDHPRVIYPGPVNLPIKATVATGNRRRRVIIGAAY